MRKLRSCTKTDGDFYEKLIRLVLPITFQQFMLALVSASDAWMLGLVDQESLSAVSLASQVAFVLNLFLMAMTIGQSILAAQYFGSGDMDTVKAVSGYVLKLTITVSIAFTAAAWLFPRQLMMIFTDDPVLISHGAGYLRTVALSYLLTGISQIYLCLLKNCSMAGRVSLISSVSVILNILLNAVLILGLFGFPRLEITGAAIATVIARTVEVIWSAAETLRRRQLNLVPHLGRRTDPALKRQFWQYTKPVLANEIVWGTGFTMYSVIMGHLGSDAVAANAIANIVKNLTACFCGGLGTGAGILVGNELGAGHLEKARLYGDKLCRTSVISGAVTGLLIVCLTPLVTASVHMSQQAVFYLTWMMVMCSYYMIGKSANTTTIAGIFCAGGDSRFGLICDSITMWCVSVPLGCLAAFVLKWPVLAVYFIINLDEMVKLPAVYRNYKKYHWVKNLTLDT